jgi:hypothetical protein
MEGLFMYQMDQYTVSLLHFDGDLTDQSGKVWTANGGATLSTAEREFGGSSLYVGAGGYEYISTPYTSDFDFGNNDFTIEMWVYPMAQLVSQTYLYSTNRQSIYEGIGIYGAGLTIHGLISTNGSSWLSPSSSTSLVLNQWNHVAFIRSGGNLYIAINGVLGSPVSISGSMIKSASASVFLGGFSTSAWSSFPGYIDELRISNVARWTANFTPPSNNLNAPTNLKATAGSSQVALSWTAVAGAAGYNVERSTTSGGPYTTIATNEAGTSYTDSTVTNGTTYYYVVTAIDSSKDVSANSNEVSATPVAASNALLKVIMSDSSEREYKLTTTEIDKFIQWINQNTNTGTNCYTFTDIVDGSTEYLLFGKIISFKVVSIAQ